MPQEGVILFEPFGGLCAGLEMALRAGILVHKYIYSDNDPVVARIANKRIKDMLEKYPALLRPIATRDAFTEVPQDIWDITKGDFIKAGATANGLQWMVVAGWEC